MLSACLRCNKLNNVRVPISQAQSHLRIINRSIHVEAVSEDNSSFLDVHNGNTNKADSRYRAGLFIDNLFPIKMSTFDVRSYFLLKSSESLRREIKRLLPSEMPNGFSIDSIEALERDGGSMVYFTFPSQGSQDKARAAAQNFVDQICKHLHEIHARNWYSIRPIHAFPINGIPFKEDIAHHLPSRKIKVEFNGPDLTYEQLYNEFRQFGRILDIQVQPSSNKDTPRWSHILFKSIRSAASARCCIHGEVIGSTKIALSYVQVRSENIIFEWFKSHSKFTIPLAAAALIAAIYAVFDPIREFSVENKLTNRFNLSRLRIPIFGNSYYDGIRSIWRAVRNEVSDKGEVSTWSERAEQEERLHSILNEPPENFVVLTGPHGSGKTTIINDATSTKKYRVVIDAEKLASLHSELEQMSMLAKQLGYWPAFNSIISITNAIDLMVAATTGSKAGVSATPESQVHKILECLALALTNIRRDRLMAARMLEYKKNPRNKKHSPQLSDIDILSNIQMLPTEEIPVIILENFKNKSMPFDDIILEWAADMVEAGLAHAVVTTRSIGGFREIQRAQAQRSVSLISLDDASPLGALTMLQRQLTPTAPEEPLGGIHDEKSRDEYIHKLDDYQHQVDMISGDQLAYAVNMLGGRFEDLQVFAQKVRLGESIDGSLEDIIQRSITEIRKYAFADDAEVGQHEHTWSPEQFWFLLSELAKCESIQYDRVRGSPLFAGHDNALLGLEDAELISMQYENDRPSRIRPGRPVFREAFKRILEDPGFSSSMAIKMNKKLVDMESAKIEKAEKELSLLNVFKASSDSYNSLTSSAVTLAVARDTLGDMPWGNKRNKEKDLQNDPDISGALITKALQAGGVDSALLYIDGKPQHSVQPKQRKSSWFGWLFGSKKAIDSDLKTLKHVHGDQSPSEGNTKPGKWEATVIPGIPYELQGRVRFLLKTIKESQEKIDKWHSEISTQSARLSSL